MAITLEVFVGGYRMNNEEDEIRHEIYRAIEDLYPDFDPYILTGLYGGGGAVREERTLAKIEECDVFVTVLVRTMTPWERMEVITAVENRKPIVVVAVEFDEFFDKEFFGVWSDKEFFQRLRRSSSLVTITKVRRESAPKMATTALKRLSKKLIIGIGDKKRRSPTGISIHRIPLDMNSVEWVRAGVVQLNYEFDNLAKPKLKDPPVVADLVSTAIQTAIAKKLDLLVFPELAGSEEIEKQLVTADLKVIIGPTRILGGFNVCPIFCKKKRYRYRKLHRSKYQDSPVSGEGIKLGNQLLLFKTELGCICPLICDDFRHEATNAAIEAEFIVVPSYNPKPRRFRERASIIVEDFHKYILIANCSEHGFSAIYGIIDDEYHQPLENKGLRDVNAPSYELARMPVGVEGFLTAEFNIRRTAVSVPTALLDQYPNVRNIAAMDLHGNIISLRAKSSGA